VPPFRPNMVLIQGDTTTAFALGTNWGLNLVGDYYHSPFYLRGGTSIGFFRSFERREIAPIGLDVSKLADPICTRGHRGGVIPMHRALAHFRLGPMNLITAIFLFVFFLSVWLLLLPRVCYFWNRVLTFGIRVLPLRAEIGLAEHHLTRFIRFDIPHLRMEPVLPSAEVWWLTLAATLALCAASFLLPTRLIPIIYLLRGILLVPATALIYFALLPARFPHTPDSYMQGLVAAGIALISAVPLLFGLTYYIFDFGLLKKASLTAITMAHLVLFLFFSKRCS
jgi:hypothetical protein